MEDRNPPRARRLVVLGATGTVGRQALDILERARSPLRVTALSAHRSASGLEALAEALEARQGLRPRTFLTAEAAQAESLRAFLLEGGYGVCLQAMVGAAGLPFSEAVLRAGRRLALANKESLVLAGGLLMDLARQSGASVVPVDSEHSAIHQCLQGQPPDSVRRLWLTASGGALRDLGPEQLDAVTPEQALAHPNWDMGPRITVDSATMMNKALEILEAVHLFGVSPDRIGVLLHRQSVVHSLVEFVDGSILAQMGPPDMAFPIHYALHAPGRRPAPLRGFDAGLFRHLDFEEPDPLRWPALDLGFEAARRGGAAGAVLNAADEVAVEAFLEGRIPFPAIVGLCRLALEEMPALEASSLEEIEAADAWARERVRSACASLS